MIRVTVWNEYLHDDPTFEHCSEEAIKQHPNGLHETIADIVRELGDEVEVRTAQMKQPENGLTDEVLENTDVMIWWGHMGHQFVADEVVEKVYKRIMNGMGLIVLHSGHYSKIFRKLNGTTCSLKWRDGTYERLFNVKPTHPIADGIPEHFELGIEECYGEYFDIATPDDVIFEGWYDIGEVFRSGCTFTRGYGKIFYFQPGHETNGSFYNPHVRRIIQNAVHWCYNDKNRRITLGAPSIETTLEQARLEGNTGEYLKMWD